MIDLMITITNVRDIEKASGNGMLANDINLDYLYIQF